MKKQSIKLFAVAMILAVSATYVSAVPEKRDAFNVEVPFEFQIGKSVFKAGKYKVFRQGQSRIIIENRETGNQKIYLGRYDGRYNRGDAKYTLRFNKYGKKHFLRRVTARGSKFDLPKTRVEKRQKEAAARVVLGP